MIDVIDLRKSFGANDVLRGINITINKGEGSNDRNHKNQQGIDIFRFKQSCSYNHNHKQIYHSFWIYTG